MAPTATPAMTRRRSRTERTHSTGKVTPPELQVLRRLEPRDFALASEADPSRPLDLTRRDLARIGVTLIAGGTEQVGTPDGPDAIALESMAGFADELELTRDQLMDLAMSIMLLGRGGSARNNSADSFQWVASVLVATEVSLNPTAVRTGIQLAAAIAGECVRGNFEGILRLSSAEQSLLVDALSGPLGVLLTGPMLDALLFVVGSGDVDERAIGVAILRGRETPFVGAPEMLSFLVRFIGRDAQALLLAEVMVETLERYATWAAAVRRGPLLPATYEDRIDARNYRKAADRCRLVVARILIALRRSPQDVAATLAAIRDPALSGAKELCQILADLGAASADDLAISDDYDRAAEFVQKLRAQTDAVEELRTKIGREAAKSTRVPIELARETTVLRAFAHFAADDYAVAAESLQDPVLEFAEPLGADARWLLALCLVKLANGGQAGLHSSHGDAVQAVIHALEFGHRPAVKTLEELTAMLGFSAREMRVHFRPVAARCMSFARMPSADAPDAIGEAARRLFSAHVSDPTAERFASAIQDRLTYVPGTDDWSPRRSLREVGETEEPDGLLAAWIAYLQLREDIDSVHEATQRADVEASSAAEYERVARLAREQAADRQERADRRRARRSSRLSYEELLADEADEPTPELLTQEIFADRLGLLYAVPDRRVAFDIGDRLAAVTPSDRVLDEQWEIALCVGGVGRSALGERESDIERIRVLVRLGRDRAACNAVSSLFWQAINGNRGDADDFAAMAQELGAPKDELERMTTALHGSEETLSAIVAPMTILFAGGNETQMRYQPLLDAEFAERFEGRIALEWFSTGWSSNWKSDALRVEAAYERGDALVLMRYVRTNLGQRLRRTAGEAGLPWVPCTGHGRESLRRAIEHAAVVVSAQARPRTGDVS